MRRLIPAYVEEEAWINLAFEFEIDMQVEVKVHKVRWLCCKHQSHLCLAQACTALASALPIIGSSRQCPANTCALLQVFPGPRCRFPIQLELLEPDHLRSQM